MSRERALAATQDLAFEAKALGRHRDVLGDAAKMRANKSGNYVRGPYYEPPPGIEPGAEWAATCWERERMDVWRKAGRLTADGTLRVPPPGTVKAWTIETVMATWPHLTMWDRLAVLLELDGVVEEGYLDKDNKAHENIREVVQHISRDEVERVLRSPGARDLVAEIVHEQVGVVFEGMLDRIKGNKTTARPGAGKQQKCSKCKQPGHRATTCGRQRDAAPPVETGGGADE